MKIREYSGPLTVFMMGILGFSLFCIVSAVALAGANEAHPVSIGPQNIVDSAFSNISTVAALTVEVITQYVSTPTPTPSLTDTLAFSPTSNLLSTPTRLNLFASKAPTRTRRPDPTSGPSPTATRVPSSTPSRVPSSTPSRTFTPEPTNTQTPEPTNTPIPTDTDTPVPTDTPIPDTPIPPTDTPVPDTPVPTETAAQIQLTLPTTDAP